MGVDMTIDGAFDDWLDGLTPTNSVRRECVDPKDIIKLRWAFTFGWLLALDHKEKEVE